MPLCHPIFFSILPSMHGCPRFEPCLLPCCLWCVIYLWEEACSPYLHSCFYSTLLMYSTWSTLTVCWCLLLSIGHSKCLDAGRRFLDGAQSGHGCASVGRRRGISRVVPLPAVFFLCLVAWANMDKTCKWRHRWWPSLPACRSIPCADIRAAAYLPGRLLPTSRHNTAATCRGLRGTLVANIVLDISAASGCNRTDAIGLRDLLSAYQRISCSSGAGISKTHYDVCHYARRPRGFRRRGKESMAAARTRYKRDGEWASALKRRLQQAYASGDGRGLSCGTTDGGACGAW